MVPDVLYLSGLDTYFHCSGKQRHAMNQDQQTADTPPPSDRARIRRASERGHYDSATIHAIVDDAWLCHVSFACPDVLCLPTACWRVGDKLYIHGSNGSRMMKHLASGAPACVAITHLDGLVMARSAFSHSMNFRSVVIHGAFEVVPDADKVEILHALMEHIAPGRSRDARAPDANELKATTVLGIPLREAAAKIRAWGPKDNEEDMALPVWAGVLPIAEQHLPAISELGFDGPMPAYISAWGQPSRQGQ
jgi:nitroimidazol reductase NimA-like FMN-containing flavoprotein (pyridoxamine 5'-phosphate oxidase superfamily)